MLAIMAAGGAIAAAGIWLMLRETATGGAAKIAVGPVQFQSASVGFTVFLAGSTAFTAPLVAPEATEKLFEKVATATSGGLADIGPTRGKQAGSSAPDGLMPADAEPDNDTIEGAALVRVDDLAGGEHNGQNSDWFELDTADLGDRRIAVEISEQIEDCYAHFYDGQQNYMGLVSLVPGRNQFDLEVNDNRSFFVQLSCMKSSALDHYYVTFRAMPPQIHLPGSSAEASDPPPDL